MKLNLATIGRNRQFTQTSTAHYPRRLPVKRESLLSTNAAARQYLRELRASEMDAWLSTGGDYLARSAQA